ncbi:MAG: hypothetical protein K0R29_1480 [Pseudobdellovibrio sp.]|jgi:hypothetical protein|nr:hypothetical protein [Pseudobdellovibrio sp.]
MKKIFLTLTLAMLIANSASAVSRGHLLKSIPQPQLEQLQKSIEYTVQSRSGFNSLTNFKINWESAGQCLEAYNELYDTMTGACSVSFSAHQVQGEALVIVKDYGYATSVLYLNVE